MRTLFGLSAFLILGAALSACAPSTNRFDVINHKLRMPGTTHQVTRWELGAQGSAAQATDGVYRLSKVSVGGSFHHQPTVSETYRVRPGLQGRPDAVR
jgi:hypothetical protein